MTHAELVARGEAWLRNKKRCKAILVETSAGYASQVPDVIGWTWRGDCFEVECKASRADLLADFKKPHRQAGASHLGSRRYYLIPDELGAPALPAGWGLLVVRGRCVREVISAPLNENRDLFAETLLLTAVLARYQAQGLAYKTIAEQHRERLDQYARDRERGIYYGAEAEAQALMGRLGVR